MWNKMADIEQVFRDEDDRRAVLLNILGNQMITMKFKLKAFEPDDLLGNAKFVTEIEFEKSVRDIFLPVITFTCLLF